MAGEEGYTRRDPDQHSGYTRRNTDNESGYTRRDENNHAGYTRRDSAGGGVAPTGQNNYDDKGGYTRRLSPGAHRSRKSLKDDEESAGGGPGRLAGVAANGIGSLLNKESNTPDTPFSYKGSDGKAKMGGARGFLNKHKKKVIAGSLAGIGVLPLLALLIFLMGALKIPHFVENVAAWRFAKLTRQYRASVQNVIGEKNAIDSLDDAARAKATARYGRFQAFDKVNRLRPNKVLQSLHSSDRIQYNYKKTLTGRQKLVSITLAPGEDARTKITVKVPSGKFDRILHPFRTVDQYKTISSALDSAMKAHDPKIPLLTRTLATRAVLKKAGASLKGMTASKYLGKDTQSADLKKLYNDMVTNAQKYNALAKQLNDLMTQYDEVYKADQAFYKNEWTPAYQKWLKAHSAWTIAYGKYSKIANPTVDDMKALTGVGDDMFNASNEFDAARAKSAEFKTKLEALRGDMDNIRGQMKTLYNERIAIQEDVGKNGGTLSDRDAKIALEQEVYEQAHRNGGIAGITNDNTKQIADDANEEMDKAMQDKESVGELVDKGQDVPDSVNRAIEKGLNPGNLKAVADKVVGFANPIYDIAVPVCMAYDGSKITLEDVDAKHDSMVSEASFTLATADQQKGGTNFTTTMAGAMNWKLGNVQDSNAIRRVSGKPVNTLDSVGSQRTDLGTYGEYTIFDVFHLGMLNGAADSMCPTLTNFWVGVGVGVANLAIMAVASFFTGGAAGAAEVTATKAAEEAAEEALTQAVKRVITTATKKAIKSFASGGRFAKEYAKSTVKYGAAAAAATFLATMIVNAKAGLNSSGAEKDVAFDDNVDQGTELLSSDMGKGNFYARPLSNAEIAQSHVADRAEMAYNLKQQSSYERYLAMDNPNSLVARIAITTGSLLDRSMFASLLNSMATLFNPVGLSSKLFSDLNAKTTIAAADENTEDYGNVQWAYSVGELNLMKQDSYASPSENELRLDESGKEADITAKYDKCFQNSMGTLLTSGDIKRNEQGDITGGDCAPSNLGPNNPEFGDLVFRWRLKKNYANTTDTLLGIQDPSANAANSAPTGSTDIPSGTAQQLAQQILNNGNIDFQVKPAQENAFEKIAATGHATQCGAPAINPKILGVILAAAKSYKIVIGVLTDGHDCNGGNHPKGQAIDINGVNALDGSDGTGRFITESNYKSSAILKKFYGDMGNILAQAGGGGMGQIQCFSSKPALNNNVTYFDDTCNHLHVDVGSR